MLVDRPRWLVATTAVLGLVGTSVGAAVVIRHVSQSGWSTIAVVGLATLLLSLAVLVISVVILWRRTRGWWRLLFIPAALLSLACCASVAIAVVATIVPPTPLGRATPAEFGLAARTVTMSTADGVILTAWYVPTRNGAAVVLLHGAGDTRTATLPHASVLAEHGYGVLMLDARGHGESGGRGMEFGWFGDWDVQAAIDFLVHQSDVDPRRLAVLGLSMGAEEAIGSAAVDPRIRAVVAEGATGRTAADKATWLPGGAPGAIQRVLDHVTYGVTDLLTAASPPQRLVDAIHAAGQAQFLVVTAGTVPDEGRAAAALQRAAPDRVTVWEVAGAGHTHALQTSPSEWERRIVQFLHSALPAGETSRVDR